MPDLCDACGHAEHDAWDCRHRWDAVDQGVRVGNMRCACDRGYDGDGDLDGVDERGVTRGEVEAGRINARAHGADRSGWDMQL